MLNELDIFRGNSKTVKVSVLDEDVAYNLTGYTAKLSVKKTLTDSSSLIELTGVIDTPLDGVIAFEFTPDISNLTPGKYYYDIEIRNADPKVYTIVESILNILPVVTL
jgi:hypothetical protein